MRVALFYSLGPHFQAALDAINTEFPDAQVTAIVPPGFPWPQYNAKLVDEVFPMELSHYRPTMFADNLRLIRSIREKKFDVFVVMFDSLQLNVLASLSGAPRKLVCFPQGLLVSLEGNILSVLFREALRRIRGLFTYARIWLAVRLLLVRDRPRHDG